MTNRGIKISDIPHYLNTTDSDILDPTLIKNIKEGAKMLVNHISHKDRIWIQIDSDCDGYTSSAFLINYLYTLFPSFVQNNIYYTVHEGKEHGVILDSMPEGIKLVIIPDAGSNQFEEHELLKNNGIDVLVIDHHLADMESPYACIINNQTCDYPNKTLSGVGMVYKFCSYIDSLLGIDNANRFLDLVALGLIADVMDLRNFETKHLVVRGLQQINNPFICGMIDRNSYTLQDEITPIGIAFYISPYINATIRVGTEDEKLLLFESMLDHRGYELIPSTKRGCKGQEETRVEQACRSCTNIKNRQTKARDASLNTIKQVIEDQNLLENKILVVQLEEKVNKNLTGLMANQIAPLYQKPTLILTKDETGTKWGGSGRNFSDSKLEDFRQFLLDSNYPELCEGHANAFGFIIAEENLPKLIDYANEKLKDFDFTPTYYVDYIFHTYENFTYIIYDIADLKSCWGKGVEEPLIAIEDIKITKDMITLMGKSSSKTLKITLPNGVSLIKFRSSEEEYEQLYSDLGCVIINVVGTCERNVWNGMINPQIKIESYEIVGKRNYYF